MRQQKNIFLYTFLLLVMVLLVTPFMTTFNDLLTRLVMSVDGYKFIQDVIVPWEIRLVGVLLLPFGLQPAIVGQYLAIGGEEPFIIDIAWNCIGWQSILFFIMTAWVGLQGDRYTASSKWKAFLIGLFGTFLVNLLRIALVVLVAYYSGQKVALYVHDYGSTFAVIGWLFFFWWFSYSFVLEEPDQAKDLVVDR